MKIKKSEVYRTDDGDIAFLRDGIEYAFSSKCRTNGRREVFFGLPNQTCDTSCPIGSNPIKTLRKVKKTLEGIKVKMYFIGGNDRLERFYQKVCPSFRIN